MISFFLVSSFVEIYCSYILSYSFYYSFIYVIWYFLFCYSWHTWWRNFCVNFCANFCVMCFFLSANFCVNFCVILTFYSLLVYHFWNFLFKIVPLIILFLPTTSVSTFVSVYFPYSKNRTSVSEVCQVCQGFLRNFYVTQKLTQR